MERERECIDSVRERQLCSEDVGFVTWRSSSYAFKILTFWSKYFEKSEPNPFKWIELSCNDLITNHISAVCSFFRKIYNQSLRRSWVETLLYTSSRPILDIFKYSILPPRAYLCKYILAYYNLRTYIIINFKYFRANSPAPSTQYLATSGFFLMKFCWFIPTNDFCPPMGSIPPHHHHIQMFFFTFQAF